MKRIVMGLLMILLLSGCTANIDFNFKQNRIESTVGGSFTIEEYYSFKSDEFDVDNVSKSQKEEILYEDKDSIQINAFNNGNEVYQLEKFNNNNYNYDVLYKYDYDYTNINNSYFFNCFESFQYTEDEDYYNFKLSGSYNCTNGAKLRIKADSGIDKSNSIEIENGVHSFEIFDDDNNIMFSISKDFEHAVNKSPARVFVFVVMIILLLITFGGYYIVKIRK